MMTSHEQKLEALPKIKVGDIVIATHPEYYTYGPEGYYGVVVEIDDQTIPRKITFMRNDRLWSFYEDDLGIVEHS